MNAELFARLKAAGAEPSEVEERFIRGSGAGGQKINKTSSSVTLHHLPTGIVVRCQRERSQATNRELAWVELCERLEERTRNAAAAVRDAMEKDKRRNRPKSRGQKIRMIESKKHRAKIKQFRNRGNSEGF
jgi:protein subunit release factor B